jgi:putative ABC transport system permease protein
MFHDLRFAWRMLSRRPGFAIVAALTLALGVGGSTAVYSIVHAVLLRPLPYQDPERLVLIWDNDVREQRQKTVSYAHFEEYSRNARLIEQVSASGRSYPLLTYNGVTKQRLAGLVTPGSFDKTLGVQALLGRTFIDEDQQGGCSVVLEHSFWLTTFAADASIVGKSLTLDQKSCIVLGVMPPRVAFFPARANMWFLFGHDSTATKEPPFVVMFARLKPGVTLQQARAELVALHRGVRERDPVAERDREVDIDRVQREVAYLTNPTLGSTLGVLFGAVALVLLIACLNVSNLLLARLAERQRELVVRAALGSGQARLVRQVLTEALLLSLIGTFAGVWIAVAAVRSFLWFNPVELPLYADVAINLPVLVFAALLSLTTMLGFGLFPAIRASRVDISQPLKAAGRGFFGASSRRQVARTLIAVQMGGSFLLLIGAVLLMSSALRLGSEPLGFHPDGVTATGFTLPAARYEDPIQSSLFYESLLMRLERLPGVSAAALAGAFPPYRTNASSSIEILGNPAAPGREIEDVDQDVVSPRFFEVVGTPLLRGRAFDSRDQRGSQPVAIVNQALAEEYFPGRDPLGQQIRLRDDEGERPWRTIVGIVATWKHARGEREMNWFQSPAVYYPLAQVPNGAREVAVRSAGDIAGLGRLIEEQIAALDPSIATGDTGTLSSRLSKMLEYPRFRATMFGWFAFSALLLAAVGLHGVLSQLVAQQIQEFGVRRAVGAQTSDLLLLVARQGGIPVLTGLVAGICCSLVFGRVLSNLLFGIQSADVRALALVSVLLVAVAAVAMALPASRAARVDPMVALRDE